MDVLDVSKVAENTGDFVNKVKQVAQVFPEEERETRRSEYYPENHKIFSQTHRPRRRIVSDTKTETGDPKTDITYEERVRIAYAIQQLIVSRRVMFITGAGVEPEASPEKENKEQIRFYDIFLKTLKDNKLNNRYAPLAKAMMAQGEAMALFYIEDAPEGYWGNLATGEAGKKRIRMMLRTPDDGDTYYPVYNEYRNLIGFGIAYKLKDGDKEVEHLDYYTETEVYRFREDGGWELQEALEGARNHGFTKIPVAYFTQADSEWKAVQWVVDRKEELVSNLAENNDAFSFPILMANGEVESFANRKDTGKFIQMESGATAEYLESKNAAESIKLELETLDAIINAVTRNADTAFDKMLDIGNIATATLKLMFVDPHAAAKEHQDGHYGESVQRMYNIIKDGIKSIDNTLLKASELEITATFGTYLPKNETEELQNREKEVSILAAALSADLISQQTAIKAMPKELVPDAEAELAPAKQQKLEKDITMTF